jgi:hypothetical protein
VDIVASEFGKIVVGSKSGVNGATRRLASDMRGHLNVAK